MTEAWMIPNIPGLGGSPFFSTGGGGLSNAQAQYNQNQGYFGDQSRTLGAAQVPQSQLYGGGSFGAQPAAYAAAGAAYGRATGGFGGLGAPNADPFTPVSTGGGGGGGFPSGRVTRGPDLPDLSPSMPAQPPVPYLSGGGAPFGGGGFGRQPTVFDTGTSAVPSSPPPGSFSPSPNYPGGSRNAITQAMMPPAPNFNDTFSQFRSGGDPTATQMQNQPAINAVNQMSLGGRFNPRVPSSPPPSEAELGGTQVNGGPQGTGWTPDFQGPGDENSFANRFGFRNAGTPSEYTTAPYTDVGGTTRGPMQMPSGFSTPYSFDNPGGALGRGGFRGTQAPIMGAGDDDSQDTLTAQDAMLSNPFDAGARGIGPTMGPFMSAMPGGGVGRGTAPSSFAPSSPFAGGASPVPYPYAGGQAFPGAGIGSSRGSMRDQIAAIMSGSQGNTPPPGTSGPMINGGPQGTGSMPPPTPGMSNALDMLRQGRGWTIAQQAPPPQSGYAPINQAISSIGSVSRPGMFDNLSQPLSSMFSPGQYRGR